MSISAHRREARSGFTLLEITLVMVIIALLISGVLYGQDLIRGSQLRATTATIEKFKNAVITFRNKYNAIPGDMPNAESIWGSDAGCPATPTNTVPKTATCNGNGDDTIGWTGGATDTDYESFRAWQQMSNAGLIEGTYTGVTGPGSNFHALIGINVPPSKIPGGGHYIQHVKYGITGVLPNMYPNEYGNTIWLGMPLPNGATTEPMLTPTEALSVDTKLDDGRPGYGRMVSYALGIEPNCATDNDQTVAVYNVAFAGLACAPIFVILPP